MKITIPIAGATYVMIAATSAYGQAAGAGADFNKADRERVQKQAQIAQCMRDCDTIFRGQYAACGGYPLAAQPACNLNIDKNKAQCYQKCK